MVKEIYQHFRDEEKGTIEKLNSKFEIASRDYYPVLTDFLDPREQKMVHSLQGHYPDIKLELYGGGATGRSNRERQRVMLVPELLEVSPDDFGVMVVELSYPHKFVTLNHRNILGAIMNVGVERQLIGDIVISEDNRQVQFAIAKPYFPLFEEQLTHIRNAPVNLSEVPHQNFMAPVDDGREKMILVSSFRLDTIISEIINEGRAKSKARVEKSKVKVNHSIVTTPSFIIEADDTVSVRHFGRFKLKSVIAETRKGKYRIQMKVYRSK